MGARSAELFIYFLECPSFISSMADEYDYTRSISGVFHPHMSEEEKGWNPEEDLPLPDPVLYAQGSRRLGNPGYRGMVSSVRSDRPALDLSGGGLAPHPTSALSELPRSEGFAHSGRAPCGCCSPGGARHYSGEPFVFMMVFVLLVLLAIEFVNGAVHRSEKRLMREIDLALRRSTPTN